MGQKNFFTDFKSEFDAKQWEQYIPLNTFEHKQTNQLPEFIQRNGVSQKFNSALVVASGSSDYDFYGVIGYRPDENNTVIDEHAFVYLRDKKTDEIFGGILHHADYPGLTTPIPSHLQMALSSSGVTASISIKRMPNHPSGSLDDLLSQGILSGVSANFNISFTKINRGGK
jgi:hypothetical protein